MKKILALLLAGVMALALCACGTPVESTETTDDSSTTTAAAGDTIYIGVFEPQSGDNGAGGKQEILGMQYANSIAPTVEVNGTTYNVQLVIADNESSTDKAVSAATTLVSKGVSVVLGTYGSAVAIAGSDTFAQAGIPVIGVTCTNPQITQGNDHYFRICFLDPFQGSVLANFAYEELEAKTVYCLGQLGNDYDQGLINYFKEAGEALGMNIITESFPEGNSDFTSYLSNAKNKGADVIFAPTSITYAQLIEDQCAAQGITMPIVASDTWDSNVILGAAQGKDLSIYVSTFYAEGGDPEFEAGIKEWINADATNLSNNGGNDMIAAVTVMGYDAYFTALQAIQNAGSTDPADIMAALPDTTWTGVTGEIAFDETGDAIRDSAFIKTANVTDNVWDFVAVQTTSD
jgi:branched-chain amino acid transport system substrate-binding protein